MATLTIGDKLFQYFPTRDIIQPLPLHYKPQY